MIPSVKGKYWCMVKSPTNFGGEDWHGTCQECCVFCKKKNCELRTCKTVEKDGLCVWRAKPSEWMMARLNEKAEAFIIYRRRIEYYFKMGYRIGDSSWEGECLGRFSKRFPRVYEEIVKENRA